MSERKNIDRLFQEKFKDFEINPPEEIWGNIEAGLDKDKTRRVIPLWWKLSGIAAVFLVGLLITQTVFNNKTVPSNQVTFEETKTTKETKTTTNTSLPNSDAANPKEKIQGNVVVQNENTNDNVSQSTFEKGITDPKNYQQKNTAKKTIGNQASLNKTVAENNKSKNAVNATDRSVTSSRQTQKNGLLETEKAITDNLGTMADKENKTTTVSEISKEISLESLKGKKNSVAENDAKPNPTDSTKTKETPKNPLEELLAAIEEEPKKQETKQSKWQIISNVSPIFMGALSGGSAIDSTLANNSKSFNTNVGFGLGVSYAVSPKVTLRTGLNKLNMSYNTNDVFYFASMQTRALSGLSPSGAGHTIQVENANGPSPSASLGTSENDLLSFEQNFTKNKGYINQDIGYFEMPIEMTYAFVAKRFGLKVIGGFSTLFLQDNSISVVSDNRTIVLGAANNLNNIHFSTNIGLGLKYDLLKSFEFHIEPTFKYQINTFSNDTGNFRPYLFGVYSGFSYKF